MAHNPLKRGDLISTGNPVDPLGRWVGPSPSTSITKRASSLGCCLNMQEWAFQIKSKKGSGYTVSFAYNDNLRGIRKVSLFAKSRYTRSLIICITGGRDFALGIEMLSLFANCRYIRSRY